ncbi:hypothetical protein AB0I53_32900 [Saccharopolyspora sp. NPDC050389]|uniref:hypothetical protein n=1 Tax=Saccharopolyspora sp. NPDC050389 TaxID=3155516 RepID=UPI0033F41935
MRDFFEKKAWTRPDVPRLHALLVPEQEPPPGQLQVVAEQAEMYQKALEGQPGLLPVPAECGCT